MKTVVQHQLFIRPSVNKMKVEGLGCYDHCFFCKTISRMNIISLQAKIYVTNVKKNLLKLWKRDLTAI